MNGRQEGIAIILHPAVSPWRRDGNEGRKVGVFAAEAIADPRANAGTDQVSGPGVEAQESFTVSHAFSVHRPDKTQVIGMAGEVGKQLTDPHAGSPVLIEFER